MSTETVATYEEVRDKLSEDQQQRGREEIQVQVTSSEPTSKVKYYQNLLEEQERCGSPQYQELLPCKHNKNVRSNY